MVFFVFTWIHYVLPVAGSLLCEFKRFTGTQISPTAQVPLKAVLKGHKHHIVPSHVLCSLSLSQHNVHTDKRLAPPLKEINLGNYLLTTFYWDIIKNNSLSNQKRQRSKWWFFLIDYRHTCRHVLGLKVLTILSIFCQHSSLGKLLKTAINKD